MARYHEKKVNKELYETYSDAFAYIEKVINSCETDAQLINATLWGKKILFDIEEKECNRRQSAESWAVNAYMKHRRDIIHHIYSAKDKEINGFFT